MPFCHVQFTVNITVFDEQINDDDDNEQSKERMTEQTITQLRLGGVITVITRTVLIRRVSSCGLPAALSDYGVNAAWIAEIVVIFRTDSSLAEMPGSFA